MTNAVVFIIAWVCFGRLADWLIKPAYSKPRHEKEHVPGFDVSLKK
jgi:hypothetical protein